MTQEREAAEPSPLRVTVCGIDFQNPVLLASGTAAYGAEVADVADLELLGGIVTKAVSLERREGAPPPRVAEFGGGMLNAIGLANPGVGEVREVHLPWLASNLSKCRAIVNVVGYEREEFERVVALLEPERGFQAFELNLSCPNVKAGGLEFSADPAIVHNVVSAVRATTSRPLFVKLSPAFPNVADSARAASDAGADGLTLVNTLPGLLVDVERRKPVLGFGSGGVSGPALLPVGLLATWRISAAVSLPIIGVGGISEVDHAIQYILAGATLVAVGTAFLRDPRTPARLVRGLARWCDEAGVSDIRELVRALEWPQP